jgi:hypothetical protein
MFTGRAVTAARPAHHHGRVFAHRRGGRSARAATVVALAAGLLLPTAAAQAAPSASPTPDPSASAGANGSDAAAGQGGDDNLVTFGIATASGDSLDTRGYISFDAPAGAVLYDKVALVNLSNVPLDLDVYPADVTNAPDGSLDIAGRAETPDLAGAWLKADQSTVGVPAQSSATGPGISIVPVTITIPPDAEPGDHVGAVLTSLTAAGQAGENAPALDLEQRLAVRVYVRVQGQIRAGLTVTDVRARFVPGGVFGPGKVDVTYTLTNNGNVRFGVEPSVRGAGPFGASAVTADGTKIDELLPHSSVQQKVTLERVWPFLFENVTVSATAVSALGAEDPGIGTVKASTWTWLGSWGYLVFLGLVAAVVAWLVQRRRRRLPGTWGPPQGLWDSHAPTPPAGGGQAPAPSEPPASDGGHGPGGGNGPGAPEPPPHGAPEPAHGTPQPEPVHGGAPGHGTPEPVGGGPGHGAGPGHTGGEAGPGGHGPGGGAR